jgi:uncharacterized membrane protein YbhN (UPF0104 family)
VKDSLNYISTESKRAKKPGSRLFISLIKYLLAFAIVYFAARQFYSSWHEVIRYNWEINLFVILLSCVLHIVTFILFSRSWCVLMEAFGFVIPLRQGFKIAYIANLGRYIPGKIWPLFGMAYYLKKIDIDMRVAVASWGIATILGLPPAFLVGFVTVYFEPPMLTGFAGYKVTDFSLLLVLITLAISVFLAMAPRGTILIYNLILRILKKAPVEFELGRRTAIKVYLWYLLSWVSYGAAFYCFLHGMMAGMEIPAIAGIGSFVLAYVIGYIVFFAPGGLGARELVLTSVLFPFIGSVAVGIAVAARLWNLVNEIIAAIMALCIKSANRL